MAHTTLFVLLVASFCLLATSAPTNTGMLKGCINKAVGQTRGEMNKKLREAMTNNQAITPEGKQCLANLGKTSFNEGNTLIANTKLRLLQVAETNPEVDVVVFQKVIDTEMQRILSGWVASKVEEINQC